MKRLFTLIELLVVVAIIGILASLLLPSLQRAREAAKTAVCISNSKQVNTGLQGYFADYDDLLPVDGRIYDTWGSFLDPYLGGTDYTRPIHVSKPGMSKIWSACPNSPNRLRYPVYFRDADYAGVFNRYNRWPSGLGVISEPSESAIITEGNHEVASAELGNSWLKAGSGASLYHYNNVTGQAWGKIRHDFQKKFVISNFDGSSMAIIWKNLVTFTNDHGQWLDDF